MEIILYKSTYDKRKVNKDLSKLTSKTIHGNFKLPTDVINPTVIIDFSTDLIDYNYLYIPTLKRNYFINDTRIIGKTIEIDCHCDILTTNKNTLKNLKATIVRAEKKPNINGYLMDNQFQSYTYEQITTKKFPNGIQNDSIILITVG